ncbi:GNAT family N-acetyltransferase [Brevibacillus dissolubilis]|uniref:GNAT family N-acetyltransferase n=1 Tax=Brevibacillus dissolubilis TaxID=1844116 RepID=UPI002100154F|nr:GNAT family N-acetyltransferase [Brevibacillus dissolubilis]
MKTQSLLTIMPVTKEMQERARKLILDGLEEHFGFLDETLNPDLDDIMGNFIEKGETFLVGMVDGEIVYTGALIEDNLGAGAQSVAKAEPTTCGRIVRMSVAKSHRRQGYASQMLRTLEAAAWERDYQQIVLETNLEWDDAIGLYKHHGYVEYDRDEERIHLRKSRER